MRLRGVWPWAALCFCAFPGFGQERTLTMDEALALARERGASVILAHGRIEEARARQEQAGRRFQESPVLEVNGGLPAVRGGFLRLRGRVDPGPLTPAGSAPPGSPGGRPRSTGRRRSSPRPGACCCGTSGPPSPVPGRPVSGRASWRGAGPPPTSC